MRQLECFCLAGFLLLLPLFAVAHKEPETPQEIEVQRALQAAAYHCAPAVAEFTAARKRALRQQNIAEPPELAAQQEVFASGVIDNLNGGGSDKTFLECSSVREGQIHNNTCVLTPEVTEGPYWHQAGHLIRQNIAEYQNGLLLLLDIGVIDVQTCKPLPGAIVDIWHANASGLYGGEIWPEPPLSDPHPWNKKQTWLRGAWPTDRNGVSRFTTIFPGYYDNRATHIHVKVFTEWKALPNGSYTSDALMHTGQFFFDDDINAHIDDIHPYTMNPIRNTHGRTRNWDDSGVFQDSRGAKKEYNPVFKVDLLGFIIPQGLIGYITMGVNASARYPGGEYPPE
ncbi:Intradiol ring-cleavage dioxygenase [Crepidotus variabilis]|uniref:Intradiol ring-cleavage dioxygenase n=1 Tax=Crepidotus variabilis TaxID=179855 RepID=A0A9P6EAW8_9AGAR|nr:Intradiol ring-cleavage dioxygenase [Crepidotus variabilis]